MTTNIADLFADWQTVRLHRTPWVIDNVTTDGATPYVSDKGSLITAPGTSGRVMVSVQAQGPSGHAAISTIAVPWQNIDGVLSMGTAHESVPLNSSDDALSQISVDIVQNGATICPRVTGLDATAIEWSIEVQYDAQRKAQPPPDGWQPEPEHVPFANR